MGKSIIISSKSQDFILARSNEIITRNECFPVDMLTIAVEPEKASIGILKMNELKKWSTIKPFKSKSKIAFIQQAHLLTPEAQNSILKLLEEPSLATHIVLITNNHELLLTTIQSRCQLIIDNAQENFMDLIKITEFINLPLLEKFSFLDILEKETDKNSAINQFLISLLSYYREKLLTGKDRNYIKKIQLISETKKMIIAKVTSRNALENLIIQLD
jgi:DNA polymerase-3 subunit delta'